MEDDNLKFASKLQWHEGMLLSPQHFQYSDRRVERVIFANGLFQAYCPWGIINCAFDENLIDRGVISVAELSAIFPDGTVVDLAFSKEDDNVLELDLKKLELSGASEFEVFLCVSTEKTNRFATKIRRGVKDLNADDNAIDLPVLLPKLFLSPYKCSDNSVGYAVFKIRFDGKRFMNLPYMPPCYSVTNYPEVIKRLAAIVLSLRQKASHLVNKNQFGASSLLSRDTRDILKPVIGSLCILEPLIGFTKLHPERLFENLIRVNSLLLPLNTDRAPGALLSYDPFAPYESIEFYLELIEKSVAVIQQKYVGVSFLRQDRLFYLHLHPEFFSESLFIGFRASQGMSDYRLRQWVEESIIAADEKIEAVTSRRITGASRTPLTDSDAPDLIPGNGTVLYKLNAADEFIKIKQNLNIFNAGDSSANRPSDIVLYVRQSDS